MVILFENLKKSQMSGKEKSSFLSFLLKSVFLIELLDTTLCLSESLTACVERVAVGAGVNSDFLQNGTCFEFCAAACADDLRLVILRMCVCLHFLSLPSDLKPLCVLKESAHLY